MDKLNAFLLGMREFRSSWTTAYNDEEDHLMAAYDAGREWAHRLTFRRWDESVPRKPRMKFAAVLHHPDGSFKVYGPFHSCADAGAWGGALADENGHGEEVTVCRLIASYPLTWGE